MNWKTIAVGAVALTVAAVAAGRAARPDINVDELTDQITESLPTGGGATGGGTTSPPAWGPIVDLAPEADPADAIAGEGKSTSDETLNVIEGGQGNTGQGDADETLNVIDQSGSTSWEERNETLREASQANRSDPDDTVEPEDTQDNPIYHDSDPDVENPDSAVDLGSPDSWNFGA